MQVADYLQDEDTTARLITALSQAFLPIKSTKRSKRSSGVPQVGAFQPPTEEKCRRAIEVLDCAQPCSDCSRVCCTNLCRVLFPLPLISSVQSRVT